MHGFLFVMHKQHQQHGGRRATKEPVRHFPFWGVAMFSKLVKFASL